MRTFCVSLRGNNFIPHRDRRGRNDGLDHAGRGLDFDFPHALVPGQVFGRGGVVFNGDRLVSVVGRGRNQVQRRIAGFGREQDGSANAVLDLDPYRRAGKTLRGVVLQEPAAGVGRPFAAAVIDRNQSVQLDRVGVDDGDFSHV